MDTQQLMEAVNTIDFLKKALMPSVNQWIPVVAAIGGALAGACGAIFPNLLLERYKSKRIKEAVASALICEVDAILMIVKHRKYVEGISELATSLSGNVTYTYSVRVPAHYSRVYQTHCDKIGLIDPCLASKIINFHQLVDSVVQDVSEGGTIATNGGGKKEFQELLVIINEAVRIGNEIVKSR